MANDLLKNPSYNLLRLRIIVFALKYFSNKSVGFDFCKKIFYLNES